MNSYDVAHMWANKDFGKNGSRKASSVSCEGRNYYSYATVFGQWLDMEKNVVLIYEGDTSVTSHKHQLDTSYFPHYVHVFPYEDGGSYYGYQGCQLVSWLHNDSDFKYEHRVRLIDFYVEKLYYEFLNISVSKKKGAENVSLGWWQYVVTLTTLYSDISVKKWLKIKGRTSDEWKKRKKMVRMLADGTTDVEKITDAMFGEGTYRKYYEYCARFRKANDRKKQLTWLCHRLGMRSPYNKYGESWRDFSECNLSADEIRKLSARERIDLHFANLRRIEELNNESEKLDAFDKRRERAFRWICGFAPSSHYRYDVKRCVNMFTKEVYYLDRICGYYWCETDVSFDFQMFRKADDKKEWIMNFYRECKQVETNQKSIEILERIDAHTEEYRWQRKYINDDYLREHTTDEEYVLCVDFIARQDRHFEEMEIHERAMRIERERREEEERKEREMMEKVREEQISECIAANDEEGYRNLWRNHFAEVYYAEKLARDNGKEDFFNGGNVLMRLSLDKKVVQTSKQIRIDIPTCEKMFRMVQIWHERPSSFKKCTIDTKHSGKYTIESYENDVLTAGCHDISFAEMQRMYDEIQANKAS